MRYLTQYLRKDLKKKLVLLSGPRQSGKTTLAKSLSPETAYLNFDVTDDRKSIREMSWDRDKELLILDELHKLPKWKSYLKGLVDSSKHNMQTLVTGSARLDTARRVGDSLAGRYYMYRLHPIDIKEAVGVFGVKAPDAMQRIMHVSGFPEPFLENELGAYRRWRTTHSDIILRQDLIQLETVEQLVQLENLVDLLRDRVGSTIAYANLARDLGCAPKSVKRWLEILENLYVIFSLKTYSENISRSLSKSPKYYFYDCAQVRGGAGARFENLVALALKKEIEFRFDCFGDDLAMYFVRNRNGYEIDFLITKESKPWIALEAKWSDATPHNGFRVFERQLGLDKAVQLVANLETEKTYGSGLEIRSAAHWLADFALV